MKTISVTALLAILIVFDCTSQGLYSKENLKQSTPVELDLYLAKAKKLKKTGGVLLIAAPVSFTTGIILASHAWNGGTQGEWQVGATLILASFGATLAGIPVYITGSSRVKKISNVWNSKFNAVSIGFAPCNLYNYQTQNIQPGISLRIRF